MDDTASTVVTLVISIFFVMVVLTFMFLNTLERFFKYMKGDESVWWYHPYYYDDVGRLYNKEGEYLKIAVSLSSLKGGLSKGKAGLSKGLSSAKRKTAAAKRKASAVKRRASSYKKKALAAKRRAVSKAKAAKKKGSALKTKAKTKSKRGLKKIKKGSQQKLLLMMKGRFKLQYTQFIAGLPKYKSIISGINKQSAKSIWKNLKKSDANFIKKHNMLYKKLARSAKTIDSMLSKLKRGKEATYRDKVAKKLPSSFLKMYKYIGA